jgi:pimeloyl-ACP methyl ester carboxylesterase
MPVGSIHVTHWGTTGPHVLLIHGGVQGSSLGGADHFPRQRQLADRGWRLVLPDRPGHGQTPTRGPEDMELDAVWAAELMGYGSHVVGHSYGGCVALATAARRPDALKSLTLIEAPLFALAAHDPAVQMLRAEHDRLQAADMDPVARLMAFRRGLGSRRGLLAESPTKDELVRMGDALAAARSPFDWEGARAAVEAVVVGEIPVLGVTGCCSPAVESTADEVVRLTGGQRLVIDAGHHFPQVASDQLNDELHEFLSTAEA